jgi:formimidoylglutamase
MHKILDYLDRSQLPEVPNFNETLLKGCISTTCEDFENMDIVLVGNCQDEGVKRNGGRTGARKAPAAIRSKLYQLPVSDKIAGIKIIDIGDLHLNRNLEENHQIHENVVYEILQNNKKVIILGGGNDISYPDLRALWRHNRSLAAINIDSHYDVREDTPRNSGTPYRQALEEGLILAEDFYEVGQKPMVNDRKHKQYLKERNVNMFPLQSIRKNGLSSVFHQITTNIKQDQVFWGFDMDAVKSSDAPGVSAPNPIGLSAEEFCQIANLAGKDSRTQILEISEVNPEYDDPNESTSRLAAYLIISFLQGYTE